MSRETLKLLLKAPDSQLDATMVERLRVLLESDPTDEQLRLGLKDILDFCAFSSLASGFVMQFLNMEWCSVGGRPSDPPSETFLQETGQQR
jgi:hypothetical protein